ncbi:hypothetical protein H696_04771 [Fonticula alba]|uniref:Uncharacterized protein n=1 Tax=Fonticula alba TaxID=691883 RepID=A0A058Z4R8_FONAL|nr:hypothetical protein H696_04771 [Fonticula alba]KCV68477.1 hypothetical protein H696_04771 [Fonticula alba]|eukprot:XP_009496909.1 hypothetical protein H696_04771 [Fonticula alba]
MNFEFPPLRSIFADIPPPSARPGAATPARGPGDVPGGASASPALGFQVGAAAATKSSVSSLALPDSLSVLRQPGNTSSRSASSSSVFSSATSKVPRAGTEDQVFRDIFPAGSPAAPAAGAAGAAARRPMPGTPSRGPGPTASSSAFSPGAGVGADSIDLTTPDPPPTAAAAARGPAGPPSAIPTAASPMPDEISMLLMDELDYYDEIDASFSLLDDNFIRAPSAAGPAGTPASPAPGAGARAGPTASFSAAAAISRHLYTSGGPGQPLRPAGPSTPATTTTPRRPAASGLPSRMDGDSPIWQDALSSPPRQPAAQHAATSTPRRPNPPSDFPYPFDDDEDFQAAMDFEDAFDLTQEPDFDFFPPDAGPAPAAGNRAAPGIAGRQLPAPSPMSPAPAWTPLKAAPAGASAATQYNPAAGVHFAPLPSGGFRPENLPPRQPMNPQPPFSCSFFGLMDDDMARMYGSIFSLDATAAGGGGGNARQPPPRQPVSRSASGQGSGFRGRRQWH